MSEIIVVIGLPASGKTEYCKILNLSFHGVIVDDNAMENNKRIIIDLIEDGRDFIYADAMLCIPKVINLFKSFVESIEGISVEYRYFENNLEQCLINSQKPNRKYKKVDRFIKDCSEVYYIPVGVVPLKVWSE